MPFVPVLPNAAVMQHMLLQQSSSNPHLQHVAAHGAQLAGVHLLPIHADLQGWVCGCW